eukprot:9513165-Ditylum_brightwellii.AAC.1
MSSGLEALAIGILDPIMQPLLAVENTFKVIVSKHVNEHFLTAAVDCLPMEQNHNKMQVVESEFGVMPWQCKKSEAHI